MSVFIGSIPNSEKDDISLAKDILKNRVETKGSLKELAEHFDQKPFFFNRGRDALFFLLKTIGVKEGDEVITQAFTCVAVVAPILWAKGKPVYVDIKLNDFNLDVDLLKEKITEKTKTIIIQHTFGNLADMKRIHEIIDIENQKRGEENKIYVIEDSAHIYSNMHKDLGVGIYSDVYFFSFSQDKSISSTQGSALLFNDKDLERKAELAYTKVEELSPKQASYNAQYIKLWSLIKKTYFKKLIPFSNITIGKVLIILFRTLGLIKKQADLETINNPSIHRMSEIQAKLFLNQIEKAERFNEHRKSISQIYTNSIDQKFSKTVGEGVMLRYPILVNNRSEIKKYFSKKGIILGNWYSSVVFPLQETLSDVEYVDGSCSKAEFASKHVLNLPLNIETTKQDASEIVEYINSFAKEAKF